jgi:hypothetical protein
MLALAIPIKKTFVARNTQRHSAMKPGHITLTISLRYQRLETTSFVSERRRHNERYGATLIPAISAGSYVPFVSI